MSLVLQIVQPPLHFREVTENFISMADARHYACKSEREMSCCARAGPALAQSLARLTTQKCGSGSKIDMDRRVRHPDRSRSRMPLPDHVAGDDRPAVHELREHALWSEGMVWCSPEQRDHEAPDRLPRAPDAWASTDTGVDAGGHAEKRRPNGNNGLITLITFQPEPKIALLISLGGRAPMAHRPNYTTP